jgi:hypothetical protein
LQGTNKGEFYTDVCRDVSGLIISFLLKFSSSAEKGGNQGTALQARIARYLIIRYLEFEFYLPFFSLFCSISPLFQHSKKIFGGKLHTDECVHYCIFHRIASKPLLIRRLTKN